MRLREIEITPCVLKLRQPVQNASTAFHERHSLLIRLIAEDGRCGRGEVTPLPEFGTESLQLSKLSLELAAKKLRDRELPSSTQEVDQLLSEIGDWTARPAARFGLELGLLDLASQSAGLRLSRFLNSSAISSVEVNALLTGSKPEELAKEASAAVREGYRVLKVKVAGRALADDARRLETGTWAIPSHYPGLAALELILEVGVSNIQERLRDLTARILERCEAAGVKTFTPRERERRCGIVTLECDHPEGVEARLHADGVIVDSRPGRIRLSPHWCVTEEELERGIDLVFKHLGKE